MNKAANNMNKIRVVFHNTGKVKYFNSEKIGIDVRLNRKRKIYYKQRKNSILEENSKVY